MTKTTHNDNESMVHSTITSNSDMNKQKKNILDISEFSAVEDHNNTQSDYVNYSDRKGDRNDDDDDDDDDENNDNGNDDNDDVETVYEFDEVVLTYKTTTMTAQTEIDKIRQLQWRRIMDERLKRLGFDDNVKNNDDSNDENGENNHSNKNNNDNNSNKNINNNNNNNNNDSKNNNSSNNPPWRLFVYKAFNQPVDNCELKK